MSAAGASWHILSLPAGISQIHQPSGSHERAQWESTVGIRITPTGNRGSWAPVKAKATFGVWAESSGLVSPFPSSGRVPIPKMPGHRLCGGEGQIFTPRAAQPRPWARHSLEVKAAGAAQQQESRSHSMHGVMQPLRGSGQDQASLVWVPGTPRGWCWAMP